MTDSEASQVKESDRAITSRSRDSMTCSGLLIVVGRTRGINALYGFTQIFTWLHQHLLLSQ
jgi:hypothetical protein